MLDWLQENGNLAIWLTAASIITFIGSILATGFLIVRLPADYFTHDKRPPRTNPRRGLLLRIIKNLAGVILILIGIVLLAMPGKYRFEKWLVSRGKVLKAMNWLRHKRHKPPLSPPAAGSPLSHPKP